MDEYISREAVLQTLQKANIGGYITERLLEIPAADVQPVNQWISVNDRLPDEDDCYLVVIESEICVSIDIAEYSENRWHKHDKVLYWQPLPEPPKDGDTSE